MMTTESWEQLFQLWDSARRGKAASELDKCITQGRSRLSTNTPKDWQVLSDALADEPQKWFVANIFASAPVPKRLFEPFISAAIHETSPSLNRYFVEPCLASFGHRKVNETLLEIVENETTFEIAGAVAALYWANLPLCSSGDSPDFTIEYATPESRKAYLELQDVWDRKRSLYLRTFIHNEDVEVRRQIIPSLNLNESAYPNDLKPLVSQAITIARNNGDDYIRHRVEVQLGNEKLLWPIPDRQRTEAE